MTSPALPRRVAAFLLQSAIFIAPHDTLDWGHAMLAELHHVQGNWAALLWSLGSAGVLAKHTLLSLIFPGRNRSTVPSGGGLLIKEGPVRKPARRNCRLRHRLSPFLLRAGLPPGGPRFSPPLGIRL